VPWAWQSDTAVIDGEAAEVLDGGVVVCAETRADMKRSTAVEEMDHMVNVTNHA